ncbi:NACHT domain-containing protein [Cystobacter fuscus]|uniref:NACHT domain-containing protein n=1 Tax=Cystobacter fuscus TaxID=43 RepID=UPI0037C09871
MELQRFASDVYSARLFLEVVDFIPESDVDPIVARAKLAAWQRERFGRLDLRGFVRSESEDVSWRIEDIYQDIKATYSRIGGGKSVAVYEGPDAPLISWLGKFREPELLRALGVVVLGHPGSGKTFFLRWLAISASQQGSLLGIDSPIPVLTSLAAYAQAPGPVSLYDYFLEVLLENDQPAAHIMELAVAEKRAIFLLDGLDEVGDELARRKMSDAVETLIKRVPGCLVVVTSRIAGYDTAVLSAAHVLLSPFDDESIRRFLVRWCELYARDRLGNSRAASREGKNEGERLARDVLQHKEVHELARNPLLLTVLAMVHRAGVRLPDHRVELYEHATRVLVERWNRVRGLSHVKDAPPLKAADAVRLLGPVALEAVRTGTTRGAIPENSLRDMLKRSLANGNLRGVASPDVAIELFKNSLGLLVEQGPGLYSFLHLTLAEYFAAWELVRSNELERLASDSTNAYYPEWREVLLLAAGELGVNRADDNRLANLVESLLDSAARRQGRPSAAVPSLLGGLLADDPGLSASSAESLVYALIPTWWFARAYGKGSLPLVVREALQLVYERIVRGRFREMLRNRIDVFYGAGIPSDVLENLCRGGFLALSTFVQFLQYVEVDYGPALVQFLKLPASQWRADSDSFISGQVAVLGKMMAVRIPVSKFLDEQVRVGRMRLVFGVKVFVIRDAENRYSKVLDVLFPWEQTQLAADVDRARVFVVAMIPVPGELHQIKRFWSSVSIQVAV